MIDRFRAGFQTELGTIFLLLVCVLLGLALAYFLLLLYQKSKDRLRYQYQSYYDQAEKLLSAYKTVGKSVAELFGRETVIANSDGIKALCLIPPPPIVSDDVKKRFEEYIHSIGTVNFSMLAPYSWSSTQNAWVIIQEKLLHQDGRKLLTLDKYAKDGRLSNADKEKILINIAKCLSRLHKCHTTSGEALYHGFLLPRSIFIDIDSKNEVREILIAYHGLAFSIGKEIFQTHLHNLQKGKLIIDKWIANDLVSQVKLLAPEQLNVKQLDHVGPASDFYTFANLALLTFCGSIIRDTTNFDWSVIPESWHPFLKSCLSENVNDRPKDFGELEDWLEDPEMGLTIHGAEVSLKDFQPGDQQSHGKDLYDAPNGIDISAVQSIGKTETKGDTPAKFSEHYSAGMKAFSAAKWKQANNKFRQAIELDSENLDARIHLAITFYELGDMVKAESHYKHVKELNPQLAKAFRKHIAFRM